MTEFDKAKLAERVLFWLAFLFYSGLLIGIIYNKPWLTALSITCVLGIACLALLHHHLQERKQL